MFFTACKNDTFWDTERYFEINKNEYMVGDTIDLTINIRGIAEEKVVRLYSNYSNISISFSLVNSELNVLNEQWSQSSEETLPRSKIKEVTITPDSSFTKTFKGVILSEGDSIKIQFSELNLDVKYSKERLKRDHIRIHGFCRPINPAWIDPLEDYFEPKDIKINLIDE